MTTEKQENKAPSQLAYFDQPSHSRSRIPLYNTPFDASTVLTMMLLFSTLIPVAYAQGANGGAYFTAQFYQSLRVVLPITGIIFALGALWFYYFIIRPANQHDRVARPAHVPTPTQLNNSEANPIDNTPTFQNRFKHLEELLEAMKNEIQSLNEEKLSNEYRLLLSELNKFQETHSCPIHHDIMNIPTTLSSGITYDKNSIIDHLKMHNFCPVSKNPVPKTVPAVDIFRKNLMANSLKALEDKANALRLSLDERKAINQTGTKQDSNSIAETELRHRPH